MAFFVFLNQENVNGTIYRIAKTQEDLDNLNIDKNIYKIITDTDDNFNLVNLSKKIPLKFNENVIIYMDTNVFYLSKDQMQNVINSNIKNINLFLDFNPNHPYFKKWNDYKAILTSLSLNDIVFPYNKSIEEHINSIGQTPINLLQHLLVS
jgi:hypothetical protein